ncbi:uncharacterized protein BX663DRAFT_543088 [Cokeromyces recurvatus]|uniref:uncharacterized protein n=1 Tax=Cokeromyces recurvatus TaxID=90255 RepID=UPI00221E59BC|nr:uncharacterized protein BX663DRAFT_543088 [Cokeromyces recurvatus]KAI7903116.1 hypothetical protein BX663DRAFT_543088 [Cokeromyces recurvatus]
MSYQLKIHVENNTLILRGSPEESVGCVLRGCVILRIKESIKVKSITLSFTGKLKLQWNERNHQHKKETTVLEHHWSFLSNQHKKLHLLTPNNVYKYPFEYILPGNLGESIDPNSYGSLLYKLKAVVDRPAFSPNLVDRQLIRIVRELLPPYDYHRGGSLQISNEWPNKIDYRISIPKKAFSRGEQIPIHFLISPKQNSDEQLRVRYLSCFFKEYTTISNRTESRIIRFFRDEAFPSEGLHWEKTETIMVPFSFDSIQCDTIYNPYFKIEHKLKFTMSLINKQGLIIELRASLPIEIINQKPQEDDNINELPTYENAWRSLPYSGLPYLVDSPNPALCSPIEEESYPITPPLNCNPFTNDDYFGYQPCSGNLPSYHSLIVSCHDNELPAYEI